MHHFDAMSPKPYSALLHVDCSNGKYLIHQEKSTKT